MKDELKIGIVIGIALFIFGFLVVAIGNVKFWQKGYRFTIRFDYVSGLPNGAPVMVSGMDAGVVKGLYLKNKKVYVKVWVKEGIDIPSDSMVTVNTLGLLGEKYVEITLGKSQDKVKNNDLLIGINPVNVSEILTRSETVVDKLERTVTILDKLMGEKELLENFENSLKNLAKITKDSGEIISGHKEEIIKAIENFSLASKYISEITKENKENIKSAIIELKEATSSFQKIAKSIDKEALSNSIIQFNKAASGLNKIIEGIKVEELRSGAGSFNKAMADLQRLMREMEKGSQSITVFLKITKNLEELSDDLKKNPWKLLRK